MSGITNFASSGQALTAALLASSIDPADAIRLLSSMVAYSPASAVPSGSVGGSMTTMQGGINDLMRRSAIAAMARASALYQPTSFDDAVNVRTQLCALFDAEILIAGNQGADATYTALRALRASVVNDLTTRGAVLATLTTMTSNLPLPAPVLAQRNYRDSTRADELIVEANPIHPAFMPTKFKALSQ